MLTSSALIVVLTLALVAGIRKAAPRIDGPWLVLAVGTAVGCGLSLAGAYMPGGDAIGLWPALVRGASAAAVAFGFSSYLQWVASKLPGVSIDARTLVEPTPADKGVTYKITVDANQATAVLDELAKRADELASAVAGRKDDK